MVARRILSNLERGFYVDVGAYDPERFSNTAWFYRRGWSGINIEADPKLVDRLRRRRPRDETIGCGVGTASGSLTLVVFEEPALNTFDESLAALRERHGSKVVDRIAVPVRTLADILDSSFPKGLEIDLLTVDVEGFDLDVLMSNDWARFSPTLVLVESHGNSCESVARDPVAKFMTDVGYVAIAKTFSTLVFAQRPFAVSRGMSSSA